MMLELLKKEAGNELWRVYVRAAGAGVASIGVLLVVYEVLQAQEPPDGRHLVAFLLCLVLYLFGARSVFRWVTELIERVLHQIKMRLVDKIARTELAGLERIEAAELYDRLTENLKIISNASGFFANALLSAFALLMGMFLVARSSPAALALFLLFFVLMTAQHIKKEQEIFSYLEECARQRIELLDRLSDQLMGHKEIAYSQQRGRELRLDLAQASAKLGKSTARASDSFDDLILTYESGYCLLIGVFVFVLPRLSLITVGQGQGLGAALLFLRGAQIGIFSGFRYYARSRQSLQEVTALESKLDEAAQELPPIAVSPWGQRFSRLQLRGLAYSYADQSGDRSFFVGPIDLTLQAGEIVFIVGGNGSGKSTFLKLLTGLYQPCGGTLEVDDVRVAIENRVAYREMFSAIFTDFHLFSKLYGIPEERAQAVPDLLAQLRLAGKTDFRLHAFTHRDLSTGQRKRLALIVAVLEDRPIYVFDEWAADQDPDFRKYFYEELLPAFKRQGKTILAVTHDDRYFHTADRVLKMEYGQLHPLEIRAEERAAAGSPSAPDSRGLPGEG